MNLPGTRSLRARITLLATVLVAAVSLLLLWLAWTLVRDSLDAVPQMPPGSTVVVDGVEVDASTLAEHLRVHARDRMLLFGSISFLLVVAAAAILAWTFTSRVLLPLREITGTARRLSIESTGGADRRGPAPATSWPSWPARSTTCSTGSRPRSRRNATSSRTRATSCGRRCR